MKSNPMERPLAEVDPDIAQAIENEERRQHEGLELIASENFVSEAVLEATGSVFTNKYAEGYPGRAITAAANSRTWWRTWRASGPASCSARNMPMCSRIQGRRPTRRRMPRCCRPATPSWASTWRTAGTSRTGTNSTFRARPTTMVPYSVRKEDERIDYDELARLAAEHSRR